jgi:hypothetical protein
MAITRLNSLAIPAGTVETADLSYPLTNFSSTGIDDNATSTAITIDSSENVGIGVTAGFLGGGSLALQRDKAIRWQDASNGTQYADIYGSLSSALVFRTGSSSAERMRIDSSGNVGIGLIPSTWSTGKAVELGFQGNALWGNAADEVIVSQNAYYNSGWKYATTRAASHYSQYNGAHRWFTAAPGTADSALTWTQAMTLDSSGRVGIGTTTLFNPLTVKLTPNTNSKTSGSAFDGGAIRLTSSSGLSGTNSEMAILAGLEDSLSAGIGFARQNTGDWGTQIRFYTHGTAITTTDELTERMRIDASGNVGIGTTSPSAVISSSKIAQVASSGNTTLSVKSTDSVNDRSAIVEILSSGNGGSKSIILYGDTDTSPSSPSPLVFQGYHSGARTERMRLDASGNVLVGCTSYGSVTTNGVQLGNNGSSVFRSASDIPIYLNRVVYNSGYYAVISIYREGVQSGFIAASQGSTPSFAAPSDIRLKENVTDHESELSNIMSLRPVRWDWKDSKRHSGEGFIAQDLEQTAWSDLVYEGEDGYKNVTGLGVVETRLIKALQEAVTRIETLEAEVAALKGA